MKIVKLRLQEGIIDWTQFDPLHTKERPLFGAVAGYLDDGRTLVIYKGSRSDLEEYAKPHFTVTEVTSQKIIKWNRVNHIVTSQLNTTVNITGLIDLPDGVYLAPIIDPDEKTQFISFDVTGGSVTAEIDLPKPGKWEINASIILDSGDKISTDIPCFIVTVSKIKNK